MTGSTHTPASPKLTRDLLEHRKALLDFIYAVTRDFDVAEEIFQETALAILAEAAAGRKIEPFLPWAREVARHRVFEYHRGAAKRRRVAQLPDALLDVVAQSFDENEELRENLRARQTFLADCLQKLTDRVRAMINGRYRGGKSVLEIAQENGWTVDSVHVALSRARKALAECIARRANLKEAP